jgi:excisionase family DNA binding protein
MTDRYLTVREAADRLKVHDRTVRTMLHDGRLTKYTIKTPKSHRVRVSEAEVDRLSQPQPVSMPTGVGA